MKIYPKYCEICGEKIIEENKQEGDRFDTQNGKRVKVFKKILKCPNYFPFTIDDGTKDNLFRHGFFVYHLREDEL